MKVKVTNYRYFMRTEGLLEEAFTVTQSRGTRHLPKYDISKWLNGLGVEHDTIIDGDAPLEYKCNIGAGEDEENGKPALFTCAFDEKEIEL
jgi:hypothetical protein